VFIFLIIAALIGGAFYMVSSGKLQNLLTGSAEKISDAAVAFGELDYDLTATGEVDPDFKSAVADYIEFSEAYQAAETADNLPMALFNYIKTTMKASKVDKSISKLKGKTFTSSDYMYYVEETGKMMEKTLNELTDEVGTVASAGSDSTAAADGSAASDTATAQDDQGTSSDAATFKEMMDSYEAFFDQYIEFMQSEGAVSNVVEYAKFMAQYTETMRKLDEINEDELSSEEYSYYIEVMGRINQKLMNASLG